MTSFGTSISSPTLNPGGFLIALQDLQAVLDEVNEVFADIVSICP
jgi:hypothetical protein